MIAGTRSANDESLARDEGGDRNLFMEVATYKTVQRRQLRMMPATAKHFYRLWMQLCAEQPSSEGGHRGVCDDQAARRTTRPHGLQPADLIDNYDIRRGCVRMCDPGAGDYHEDSLPGDIIGAEVGWADPRVYDQVEQPRLALPKGC